MDNSVTKKVAEQIAGLAPKVVDKMVDILVDRELKKRTDAMVLVMDRLSGFENDMRKLKPDVQAYAEGSLELTTWYSKERKEQREKLQQKIDKHTNALNKALEKDDFSDVYNLAKGNDSGPAKDAGGEES